MFKNCPAFGHVFQVLKKTTKICLFWACSLLTKQSCACMLGWGPRKKSKWGCFSAIFGMRGVIRAFLEGIADVSRSRKRIMCATLYGFIRFKSRPDNWSAPRESVSDHGHWQHIKRDTATLGRHVHFHSYPGRLTRARIHRVNTRVSVRPRAAR